MVSSLPEVAVIIPVYNRTSYLGATIRSVLAQSTAGWRIIVVDDGSTEDVAGFVSRFDDPRISTVHQSNQGNAAARNAGIQQTSGEYVICLDSDDVWQPDFLVRSTRYLAEHPDVDVVYTQVQPIGAEGQILPRPTGPPPRNGDLLPDLLLGYPILPSSAVIRRRCFDRWGLFTPGLDDWDLWLRWAAHRCRFGCIEQPLVQYRIHDQNLNLDFGRRRAAHFAMLDRFYSQAHLPKEAVQLRARAYAAQHLHFAVLAWEVGRPNDGTADFGAAAMRNPAYLSEFDFYTRIACAHQERVDMGTPRGLSLVAAEATVTQCLTALFDQPDLPGDIRRRRHEAYGWAYLALARLAYGVAQDMPRTRQWLGQAVRAWPKLSWRSDWALWLARSMFGHKRVETVKQIVLRRSDHA